MLGQLRRTRHEVPAGAQHRGPGESVVVHKHNLIFGVALATDRAHVGVQATVHCFKPQANNATFNIIVALFASSRHDCVMLQKSPEGLTAKPFQIEPVCPSYYVI